MLPFVLINALVLAKPPWFTGHKETSCVHQERGAAVCLEDLAQFPGLLGLGLLQLLPLFCEAFQALPSPSPLVSQPAADQDVDGHEDFKEARIPVVPNMFSLQNRGIASQGVNFHYFQS